MAPDEGAEVSQVPKGALGTTMPLPRAITFWGFGGLVVLAVAFYLWWGLWYGAWADNGVYAVTITLLLFGLAGMWLVLPVPPVRATETP